MHLRPSRDIYCPEGGAFPGPEDGSSVAPSERMRVKGGRAR